MLEKMSKFNEMNHVDLLDLRHRRVCGPELPGLRSDRVATIVGDGPTHNPRLPGPRALRPG